MTLAKLNLPVHNQGKILCITRESFQFLTFGTRKSLELLAPNEAGRVCPPVLYGSLTLKVAKVKISVFFNKFLDSSRICSKMTLISQIIVFFQVSNPGPGSLWRMVRLVSLFLGSVRRGLRKSMVPRVHR